MEFTKETVVQLCTALQQERHRMRHSSSAAHTQEQRTVDARAIATKHNKYAPETNNRTEKKSSETDMPANVSH